MSNITYEVTQAEKIQNPGEQDPREAIPTLSRRERQVADCVASGLNNEGISKALGMKRGVVSNVVNRVYMKLHLAHYAHINPRVVLAIIINEDNQRKAISKWNAESRVPHLPD